MKVEIDDGLFVDPLNTISLSVMAHHAMEGRHRIKLNGSDRHFRAWLGDQAASVGEAWELLFEEGLRLEAEAPSTLGIEVAQLPASHWASSMPKLTIADAVRLLSRPFRVLVENARNDRAFLLRLATPAQRKLIADAEEKGWLTFDGAGGIGEMKMLLEGPIYSIEEARLTSWVIHDSDALLPAAPSAEAVEIGTTCKKRGVPHYCLQRRAIENYLPGESLMQWAARRPRAYVPKARAFKRLSADQRAHFNMKLGLAGDADRASEVGTLYDDLSSKNRRSLNSGFGRSIGELFQDEDAVADYHEETEARSEIQRAVGALIGLLS